MASVMAVTTEIRQSVSQDHRPAEWIYSSLLKQQINGNLKCNNLNLL